jgi:hypothetical protein
MAAGNPTSIESQKTDEQALTAGHGSNNSPPSSDRYDGSTVWVAWVDMHRARGLADPVRAGRDLSAAKALAGLIPRDRLNEILSTYLDDPDRWLDENGHALRHLDGRLNGYLNNVDPNTDAGMSQAVNRIATGLRAMGTNNTEDGNHE